MSRFIWTERANSLPAALETYILAAPFDDEPETEEEEAEVEVARKSNSDRSIVSRVERDSALAAKRLIQI